MFCKKKMQIFQHQDSSTTKNTTSLCKQPFLSQPRLPHPAESERKFHSQRGRFFKSSLKIRGVNRDSEQKSKLGALIFQRLLPLPFLTMKKIKHQKAPPRGEL